MVILLYGLSGSGKTTIAREFQKIAPDVFLLDGDVLREGLCSDLGFSPEGRSESLRRAMHCARILSLSGKIALVAMIAPYEADRRMAFEICSDVEMVDVYLDCPLEVCEKRDPKGLYKRARAGEIKNFTGIDDPFEPPKEPCYRVRTNIGATPESTASSLFTVLWRGEHLARRSCTL